MSRPVLALDDVAIAAGDQRLAEHVSFALAPGEMLGLVGESGCGKTVTALAILRLLPDPPVHIAGGRIIFNGIDLTQLPVDELRHIRGRDIGMIFQEPMTSLNPVFAVGDQIAEVLMIHRNLPRAPARRRAAELLDLVGIPAPQHHLDRYPHQLSGGQRQRVMIAIALACEPKLLIADEPTTALDVTVQVQILMLIDRLRRDLGMACLLISHDLAVVSEICDRAAVMYAGRIVESGPVAELFARPRHRYTRALIDTIPARNQPGTRLRSIAGSVPQPGIRGVGCAFAGRCSAAVDRCRTERPIERSEATHHYSCWNPVP